MKEHRTKALRVTTTNNIHSKDEPDLFGSLQLLQLELSFQPPSCLKEGENGLLDVESSSLSSVLCHTCYRNHHNKHQDKRGTASNLVLQLSSSCDISKSREVNRCNNNCNTYRYQKKDGSICWGCSNLPKLCLSNKFRISPIHLLLSDKFDDWPQQLLEIRKLVLDFPSTNVVRRNEIRDWLSWTDNDGNTALLYGGHRLIRERHYERAGELVELLLEVGSDPNVQNFEGRTLLSYSVQHMDQTLHVSRLLLNSGANVWPSGPEDNSTEDAGTSVFTWFLRGVMRRRRLDSGCLQTLSLLAQVMGEQPQKMHAHVMRTMFRHAKCYRVLGPVFLQLKLAIASHWAQPQELRYLCRNVIRQSIFKTSHRINCKSISVLGLPLQLNSFILFE